MPHGSGTAQTMQEQQDRGVGIAVVAIDVEVGRVEGSRGYHLVDRSDRGLIGWASPVRGAA